LPASGDVTHGIDLLGWGRGGFESVPSAGAAKGHAPGPPGSVSVSKL
jgi:hypothetical protein